MLNIMRNEFVKADIRELNELKGVKSEESDQGFWKAAQEHLGDIAAAENETIRLNTMDLYFHALRPLAANVALRQMNSDLAEGVESMRLDNMHEVLSRTFKVNNRKDRAFIPNEYSINAFDSVRRFLPDDSVHSQFEKEWVGVFVGGISGTTRDITKMDIAMTPSEYWSFHALNAAFMVRNGYHSLFEVLLVAARMEGANFKDHPLKS